jgi:vancomycin resistance protein YoaR
MTRLRTLLALLILLPAGGASAPPPPTASAASSAPRSEIPTVISAPAPPEVEPPIQPAPPEPWAVELGARETRFRHGGGRLNRGRSHNLRRAMSELDGTVIPAGGELSYNRLLGPRTIQRGWRTAKAFLYGEVVEQPGGGICQVSSTLHAAALEAGLVARSSRPHSRVVPYITPGLDATVSWERPDLVLHNPHPFPVRILAEEPTPGRLRVTVLGKERLWEVRIRLRTVEGEAPDVLFRKRADRPRGWERVAEEGGPELTVQRSISRRALGTGETSTEEAELRYDPTDRVVEIGTADPDE